MVGWRSVVSIVFRGKTKLRLAPLFISTLSCIWVLRQNPWSLTNQKILDRGGRFCKRLYAGWLIHATRSFEKRFRTCGPWLVGARTFDVVLCIVPRIKIQLNRQTLLSESSRYSFYRLLAPWLKSTCTTVQKVQPIGYPLVIAKSAAHNKPVGFTASLPTTTRPFWFPTTHGLSQVPTALHDLSTACTWPFLLWPLLL